MQSGSKLLGQSNTMAIGMNDMDETDQDTKKPRGKLTRNIHINVKNKLADDNARAPTIVAQDFERDDSFGGIDYDARGSRVRKGPAAFEEDGGLESFEKPDLNDI